MKSMLNFHSLELFYSVPQRGGISGRYRSLRFRCGGSESKYLQLRSVVHFFSVIPSKCRSNQSANTARSCSIPGQP